MLLFFNFEVTNLIGSRRRDPFLKKTKMPLEIIGAGKGRTGTHSLKLALEELGFGKCYHMVELLFEQPGHVAFWEKARLAPDVEWEEIFSGYRSGVDLPINRHYRELMEYYPDAKVILTVRDPERWYESFKNTIIKHDKPGLFHRLKTGVRQVFDARLRQQLKVAAYASQYLEEEFEGAFLTNKAAVIEKFKQWNEQVISTVPSDRLLVYNLRDGWSPLCDFLGVPVPDKPMPWSNATSEFNSRVV